MGQPIPDRADGPNLRGYLINPDLQREIWAHLFSSVLRAHLARLRGLQLLYVAHPPALAHLYEASRRPIKAQCSMEFDLTNERFLVPEMIFHPADLGMNQAGLAECIVRAVSSCHPHLLPVLHEREKELWPLVPDDYQVKITPQEDPIPGVWRGGSVLASSPDFETMCVTKAEYEELGSARCRKRFFQWVLEYLLNMHIQLSSAREDRQLSQTSMQPSSCLRKVKP